MNKYTIYTKERIARINSGPIYEEEIIMKKKFLSLAIAAVMAASLAACGSEAEETTASGIILAGSAKEKPQVAEVLAVGPGGMVDGKEVKMQVKVGDKVVYSKYSGTEIEIDEEKYLIVKQSDILAIIE